MNDLIISRLLPSDASALSELLTADDKDYQQYFIPFTTDLESLKERLESACEDRYWGVWFKSTLTGFFMMRGFDEGYRRPSFGVYISQLYSGKYLSRVALNYCMSWCRMNNIEAMILKVHPDNCYAKKTYEKAGFKFINTCSRTGHSIMEKRWSVVE